MSNRCFWISNSAIDALIRAKVSAEHICVYLVLANFVDHKFSNKRDVIRKARYSTAKLSAIKKYTGLYDVQTVSGILRDLERINLNKNEKLIYSIKRWNMLSRIKYIYRRKGIKYESDINYVKKRSPINSISHVFHDYEDYTLKNVTYLPTTLIEGVCFRNSRDCIEKPLKTILKLGRYKDIAARLLLLFYRSNDLEGYGGVRAANTLYVKYEKELLLEKNGFEFWATNNPILCFSNELIDGVFRKNDPLDESEKNRLLQETYELLNIRGLVYMQTVALDGDAAEQVTEPRYVLAINHSKHGYNPSDAGRTYRKKAAFEIEKILRGEGLGVASDYNDSYRFTNGRYPAISPKGYDLEVAGIVRLRLDTAGHSEEAERQLASFETRCSENFDSMVALLALQNPVSKKDINPFSTDMLCDC